MFRSLDCTPVPSKKLACKNLFGLLYLALTAFPTLAQEYFIEPRLFLTETFTDNVRLRPEDEQAVWWTRLSPALDFGARLENLEVKGTGRANILRYLGESELDREEFLFDLNNRYNTERNLWEFSGTYGRESSLTTELAETGRVDQVVNRNRIFINPSWAFLLSERQTLQAGYNFTNVDYESGGGSNLSDFTVNQASLAYLYQLFARDQLAGTAFFTRFESDANDLETDAWQVQLGWSHQFSELLEASASIGHVWTESQFTIEQEERSTDTGFIFSANITKKTERSRITGEASRTLSPSGAGALLERNEVKIVFEHELSERWEFTIDGKIIDNKSLNEVLGGVDRTFYQVTPQLSWRWTPQIRLGIGYTYRRAKNADQDNAAEANAVFFNLIYLPLKR